MAAVPDTQTNRLWVDYITASSGGVEHTMKLHYTAAQGDRTAHDQQYIVYNLLNSIGAPLFYSGWHVLRVRTALAGETYTLPQVVQPVLAGFVGTYLGIPTPIERSIQISWRGRSASTGRKISMSLIGAKSVVMSNTGRWTTTGDTGTWYNASVAMLKSLTSYHCVVDGSAPTWYNYVNTCYNSYWQRRNRIS